MNPMSNQQIEQAWARAVCDSVARTTPGFRWWRYGLLIAACLGWVFIVLVVFGLVVGARG
jgi:hypothetical protein